MAALAICAFAALFAGCSVSFGTSDTIKQDDEVKNARNFIDQQLTSLPATKSVDCPDGVSTDVGTTFTCTATMQNGQEITIPLRVASHSGSHGTLSSDPAIVDQALAVNLIYQAAKSPVRSVDCPTGAKAKKGATYTCQATLQSGEIDEITVKVVDILPSGAQRLAIAAAKRV